jgi:hypothetical protein
VSDSNTVKRELRVAGEEMEEVRDVADGVVGEKELSPRGILSEVADGSDDLHHDVAELRDDYIHICRGGGGGRGSRFAVEVMLVS